MSIETDIRNLLAGYGGLTALVGTRIAQDAVPDESAYPLVVFAVRRDAITDIGGARLVDQCSVSLQCWAETGVAAAVADQVAAAMATAPVSAGAIVIDRSTTFDPEMGLDGVLLTFQWWG